MFIRNSLENALVLVLDRNAEVEIPLVMEYQRQVNNVNGVTTGLDNLTKA